MTPLEILQIGASLESRLRSEGIPSILIPGILGAAFMASLTNLPLDERLLVIEAHSAAIASVASQVKAAAKAPDGPMD